jgi:putative aminopeptidase FrvX
MNTKLLYSLLAIESESHDSRQMEDFILKYARRRRWDISTDALGNIYLTKGQADVYPCIVAHLDTVHAITGEPIVPVTIDGKVTGMHASTMAQTGCGGDDKCGIYAALQIMSKLPACKAVLFTDEEVGCLGSSECDISFFSDAAFVLQADRRGSSDFVTSIGGRPLASAEWLEAIAPLVKAHGFSHCAGAMTDVQALRDNPAFGLSCCNLSAGYHNPHSEGEFIVLSELDNVTQLMLAICRKHGAQRWPFIAPAKPAYKAPAWQGGYTMQGGQWQRSAPEPVAKTGRPAGMPRSIWRDLREEAAYREERQRQLAEAFPYEPDDDDDWRNK